MKNKTFSYYQNVQNSIHMTIKVNDSAVLPTLIQLKSRDCFSNILNFVLELMRDYNLTSIEFYDGSKMIVNEDLTVLDSESESEKG